MYEHRHILVLVETFAAATGRRETTVAALCAGQAHAIDRLRGGASMTLRRARRIVQWLSDHWPDDLAWPDGVDRPAPEPPAGGPRSDARDPAPTTPAGGGPLAAVRRGIAAMRARLREDPPDHSGAQAAEAEAIRAAMELMPDGRVCRAAVIEALRIEPSCYDATVRRHRGGGRAAPRRGGDPERVLRLLEAAGDVRFRGRAP